MTEKGGFLLMHVEDEEAHAEYIARTLRKRNASIELQHFCDGEIALDYLLMTGWYRDEKTARPDLILLDLRLPKINGFQVLQAIKQNEDLKHIPVVFLTTSESESDLVRAYEYGVNSYLVKPLIIEDFAAMLDALGQYWICNRSITKP